MEFKVGQKIKFREDTVYCNKREIADPTSPVRIGGLCVEGKWIDNYPFEGSTGSIMWEYLEKNGYTKNDEFIIPKGTIAEIIEKGNGDGILKFNEELQSVWMICNMTIGERENDEQVLVDLVNNEKQPDNFDIFEDRVKSLLTRWRNYKNKPCPDGAIDLAKVAIKGFLSEINDQYSQYLMGGTPRP